MAPPPDLASLNSSGKDASIVARAALHGGACPCCAKKFKAPPPHGLEPGSPPEPAEGRREPACARRPSALHPRGSRRRDPFRIAMASRSNGWRRFCPIFSGSTSAWLDRLTMRGAPVGMLDASREAFAAQAKAIRRRLLSGTALQPDETGRRVGMRSWPKVPASKACRNGQRRASATRTAPASIAIRDGSRRRDPMADPSRGKTVVATFLAEFRADFRVSDRSAGQLGWAAKENQICLASAGVSIRLRRTEPLQRFPAKRIPRRVAKSR